ncbi:MAG: Chemotaxis protein methyltransferase CheR, partial [Bryobacterales bacterium]|nr:Chemotaxis protein methyltransferase CheR [Bryobacterales bacterium]
MLVGKAPSIALVALVYLVAAKLGLRLAVVHPYATAVWPPTGIALATLLLFGRGLWPGVLIGAFVANLTTSATVTAGGALASIGIAAGNTLEALLGAYLVQRFAAGRHAFDRARNVFAFAVLAAVVSTVVSAAFGVASLSLSGLASWKDAGAIGVTWWIGDAGGDLVFAPALILWLENWRIRWSRAQLLETVIAVLAAGTLAVVSFTSLLVPHKPGLGLAFLSTPALLWVAFRCGRREAAAALLLVDAIAIWAWMHGMISGELSPTYLPLELQAYMGVTSIMLLAAAAEVFQRERQQTQLEESERELRLVTDDAPIYLAHYDREGRYQFVNVAYAARFGLTPQQVVGKHISEVVGQDAFEAFRGHVDAALSGRRVDFEMEVPYQRLGLHFIRCSYVPACGVSGEPDGVVAVIEDVTEQKRTEARLQQEYALRRAIENAMPTGVATINSEGRQIYVIASFCELSGFAREDLIGAAAPFPYWPPEEMVRIQEAFEQTLLGKAPREGFRLRFQRRNGDRFDVLVMIAPVSLAEDEPSGWLACVSDITEHQRLHHQIKQQEEQLRLVIDGMPGLVAYIGRDLRYKFVNRNYAEWFHRPRAAIEEHTIAELAGEDWLDVIRAPLEEAFDGKDVTFERSVAYPDAMRTVRSTYVPDRGPDGSVRGLVVLVQDITAEARALQALRESEERFRQIVETASEGIWITDLDSATTFANNRMCEVLGYSLDELIGHSCFEFIHPEDRGRGWSGFQGRKQGDTRSREYRAYRKDGTMIWLHFTGAPIHDQSGNLSGVLGMCTDVTERKHNEARYQMLFAASEDGILIVNDEGVYVDVNQSMCDLLKASRDSLIGSRFAPYIPTERLGQAQAAFHSLVTTGRFEGEFPLRATDGNIVELEWRSIGNFVPGLHCCMARDIRERNRFHQQLQQTQKLESLGVLAGGIAHDFNNLLVGILGNASLAIDVLGHNAARPMLQDVITAGERAARLTRQLLAYAGKEQLEIAPTDMNRLVTEITPLLRTSIPKTVHLKLELQENLPYVEADQVQLQQVIMNMVINGAEAIPEGQPGLVTVTTCARRLSDDDQTRSIYPLESADEEHVVLTFTDTGVGMTPHVQRKIFDPFFTTKFTGRGLGLSAVLGIVRAHHGTLTVHSTPGQGTTFRVLLPITKVAPRPEAQTFAVVPERAAGTILVVDDEETVRMVAKRALEHCGYKVVTAEHGQQAIEILASHPEITAVVLDLAMPVMTGDQAAVHLRTQRPDLPIILSSGYPEGEATKRFAR